MKQMNIAQSRLEYVEGGIASLESIWQSRGQVLVLLFDFRFESRCEIFTQA
jgi:hypothetical protein